MIQYVLMSQRLKDIGIRDDFLVPWFLFLLAPLSIIPAYLFLIFTKSGKYD